MKPGKDKCADFFALCDITLCRATILSLKVFEIDFLNSILLEALALRIIKLFRKILRIIMSTISIFLC